MNDADSVTFLFKNAKDSTILIEKTVLCKDLGRAKVCFGPGQELNIVSTQWRLPTQGSVKTDNDSDDEGDEDDLSDVTVEQQVGFITLTRTGVMVRWEIEKPKSAKHGDEVIGFETDIVLSGDIKISVAKGMEAPAANYTASRRVFVPEKTSEKKPERPDRSKIYKPFDEDANTVVQSCARALDETCSGDRFWKTYAEAIAACFKSQRVLIVTIGKGGGRGKDGAAPREKTIKIRARWPSNEPIHNDDLQKLLNSYLFGDDNRDLRWFIRSIGENTIGAVGNKFAESWRSVIVHRWGETNTYILASAQNDVRYDAIHLDSLKRINRYVQVLASGSDECKEMSHEDVLPRILWTGVLGWLRDNGAIVREAIAYEQIKKALSLSDVKRYIQLRTGLKFLSKNYDKTVHLHTDINSAIFQNYNEFCNRERMWFRELLHDVWDYRSGITNAIPQPLAAKVDAIFRRLQASDNR